MSEATRGTTPAQRATRGPVLTWREASDAAHGWRLVLGRLQLTANLGDFEEAMAFVNEVARIAQELNHHPEIDIRYSRVHLAVSSHDVDGISERDVRFAGRVSMALDARGVSPDDDRLTDLELCLDATDPARVRPFWAAVLDYPLVDGVDGLRDPDRIGPSIRVRQTAGPREQGSRMHVDVWVAHDEAQPRIDRARGVGGRVVDDSRAPSSWVLADPEGNEAWICTWQDRDGD